MKKQSTIVLPYAWDVMSARIFQRKGFAHIATTSAGIALSHGYEDGEKIPVDDMLEIVRNIINAVEIPVIVDIESGYGDSVEKVLEIVKALISFGAAGINIEDGTNKLEQPLHSIEFQVEKIKAIRKYVNEKNVSFIINGRTDVYWLGINDYKEALNRCILYYEAGADNIFIPGVSSYELILKLKEDLPCPLNILVVKETPSLDELSNIGVEVLSLGSAQYRGTVSNLENTCDHIVNHQNLKTITEEIISYNDISNYVKVGK
ncbi:isocitrate lyase/phosphoenolpyruvate mutase family protein [Clostridium sp. MSJ-11]|uniref:Isocitrate lyase/phosphoenolpyruvate mutase family protein n=1 Tax=Clostridium mobile TaxID=2841512 RepID=A0ABS6EJB6_9CLOT|nr:isocitrate lyase/phosphoenolpyruvate mutase family protein [Clostridium mobile]MBU5485105.1 isocitrate lyase/phosphoenolpyruvate mutase family protein [Clostridium mobile]